MQIKNKIGLEAEYLLRDKNGELVFPAGYGFETDEYEILGEFRADAGFTRHETIGNFYTALVKVMNKADKEKLTLDLTGFAKITPQKKAEIMRKVGAKYVPPCNNIYKTDILSFSDDVVDAGQIVASHISAGLHVHFSRRVYHTYSSVVGDRTVATTDDKNLLTGSQIKRIVRAMDKEILPARSFDFPLKYRQPGFYELKEWGFEYRSLPMTKMLTNINELRYIVDFAFSQLERLEK